MILSVSVRAQTEKFHAQAVDRKREKEASRQRRDQLQAIRDLEARAEAENLSRDVKPSYQELADARALRDRVRHPPPQVHSILSVFSSRESHVFAVGCSYNRPAAQWSWDHWQDGCNEAGIS